MIEIEEWPPLKKALWKVVTDEKLNARYVNAWDLTAKLYEAAISTLGSGLDQSRPAYTCAESDSDKHIGPAKADAVVTISPSTVGWRTETAQQRPNALKPT